MSPSGLFLHAVHPHHHIIDLEHYLRTMTAEDGDLKTISQHTSQATLTPTSLPDGCSYGYIPSKEAGVADERVIWVDFPPASPQNPLFFSSRRKLAITVCVLIFTWMSGEHRSENRSQMHMADWRPSVHNVRLFHLRVRHVRRIWL